MALVQYLLTRDDVITQELDVHRHLTEIGHAILGRWEILCSDHHLDTGQRLSFRGINRLNPSMGMGTTQHLAVQHPGQAHIAAVDGPACDLIRPVGADRSCANDFILCRCFCHAVRASITSLRLHPVQPGRFCRTLYSDTDSPPASNALRALWAWDFSPIGPWRT